MTAARVDFAVHGPADAPAVVLVHALGADREQWRGQLPELSARMRVITFDLRGHGASPVPPGPYTIADLGADVIALLDRLEVASASLAGVSIGGAVGQWLAVHAQERVDALALVCTAARFGTPRAWRDRAAAVRAGGTASIADPVVANWFASGFAAGHPDLLRAAVDTFVATSDRGYAACCEALAGWDFVDRLAEIAAPTLVIGGREDPAAPPEATALLAERIPGAYLTLLDRVAHQAPVERPADVAALLVRHLLGDASGRADPQTGGQA